MDGNLQECCGEMHACLATVWDSSILKEVLLTTEDSKVNNHSSSTEKIALFRSYFRGREDVYAKRFYSSKTKKGGYVPACKNEWVGGACDKKEYSCGKCPNRDLLPLTDDVTCRHLEGKDDHWRDVVGLNQQGQFFLFFAKR